MNAAHTRPTVMDRIRARADRRARKIDDAPNDRGLALLDVLLGMAIFALIVIIAIQAIGQFRQRAYATATASDAQQVSIARESAMSDNPGTVPGLMNASWLATNGANLTKGNVIGAQFIAANGEGYIFCVEHRTDGTADAASLYNSWKCAVVDTERGRGCGTIMVSAANAPNYVSLP